MTRRFRSWLVALFAVLAPTALTAQAAGGIGGRVTDSASSRGLSGAQVVVREATGRTVGAAISGGNGSYRVGNLVPGTYSVLIRLFQYAPKQVDGVRVEGGGTATLDVSLALRPTQLEDVVVTSVSRAPEKLTEAPASITVVPAIQIQERAALSVLDHLKTAPGISFSEGGLVQSNIVSRGFNNIFSGSLLTIIDNRYAAVPSLRVNVPAFFSTTNDDIEQMEFVLGPGAALYGPNVTNGVLSIFTKSPLNYPGTSLSVEGGLRSSSPSVAGTNASDDGGGLFRIGFRHATRFSSKVGFKVSGELLSGDDWRYADRGDTLSPSSSGTGRRRCTRTVTGCRDFQIERWGGEARLDIKPDDNTEWITSYGRTQAGNLIELTGIGAGQARDWRYQHIQSRFRYKDFFAQVFGNFSNSGETFLLRDGNPIIDQSRQWVGQAQHGFGFGKETLIYGFDYIYTDARTDGTINGANEGDDTIKEIGAYVHSVTKFSPKFDLVTALRLDKHSRLESAVFSPRVALVFKANENNNLRLTYNRAFSTPSSNNLFLDIAAGQAGPYTVRALGVPQAGFHFRANGGCAGGVGSLCMRAIPGVPNLPTSLLPANALALYPVAVGFILQSPQIPANLKQLLQSTPVPTQVGTQLRSLNPTTATFLDIQPNQVRDIESLKPSITNTLEAGYKANLGGKVRFSIDAFVERRENFVGPLIVETPTVFLDRASLISYFTAAWTPILGGPGAAQAAAAIGTAMAGVSGGTSASGTVGVPLGTVVPNDGGPLTNRPDIFLTYRNFGSVDLFGADLGFDYIANDRWSFAATYSFINKDFFDRVKDLDNAPTDIALNGSKNRGSATIRFRNDRKGWASELRFRAAKGFPVNSGVYVSPQRADGSFVPTDSYGVFDLQGSFRPRFIAHNAIVTASLNNVLNHAYATFVGVPKIGRLLMGKVSYTF